MDTLDLLANNKKVIKIKPKEKEIKKAVDLDDNSEILRLLKARMEMGAKKYGHGVKVDQDTTDFGTEHDDWELMALEEMLDGLIYTTAAILRYRRRKEHKE